jgi:hypothetical protein
VEFISNIPELQCVSRYILSSRPIERYQISKGCLLPTRYYMACISYQFIYHTKNSTLISAERNTISLHHVIRTSVTIPHFNRKPIRPAYDFRQNPREYFSLQIFARLETQPLSGQNELIWSPVSVRRTQTNQEKAKPYPVFFHWTRPPMMLVRK